MASYGSRRCPWAHHAGGRGRLDLVELGRGLGGTTQDDCVLRIDPRTLRVAQVLQLGGNVPSVAFGFGSLWVPVGGGSVVVRIAPAGSNRPSD